MFTRGPLSTNMEKKNFTAFRDTDFVAVFFSETMSFIFVVGFCKKIIYPVTDPEWNK